MSDAVLPLLPVAIAAAGMVMALVGRQRPLGLWGSHLLTVLSGGCGGAIALGTLLQGGVWTAGPFAIVPFAALSFRLDALAAFFLLLISLVAVAAALYAAVAEGVVTAMPNRGYHPAIRFTLPSGSTADYHQNG